MLELDRLNALADRVKGSGHRSFASTVKSLFAYVEKEAGDSPVFARFESERASKWSKWGPERMGRWDWPDTEEDKMSLAWDLFRTAAERNDNGDSFIFSMYHCRSFDDNVRQFLTDFLPLLGDAINEILQSQRAASGDDGSRKKGEKFKVLDSPAQLTDDMAREPGPLGMCAIYFDLDNFKALNTKYLETVVDERLLRPLLQLVRQVVFGIGHGYHEGGDELAVLLPNANLAMGAAFADGLRKLIEEASFQIGDDAVKVTASFGVACEGKELALKTAANLGKAEAKKMGKNCVAIVRDGKVSLWRDPLMPGTSQDGQTSHEIPSVADPADPRGNTSGPT